MWKTYFFYSHMCIIIPHISELFINIYVEKVIKCYKIKFLFVENIVKKIIYFEIYKILFNIFLKHYFNLFLLTKTYFIYIIIKAMEKL